MLHSRPGTQLMLSTVAREIEMSDGKECRLLYLYPCSSQNYLQQPEYGINLRVHRQVKKMCYEYTIEYYSALGNKEILSFATA